MHRRVVLNWEYFEEVMLMEKDYPFLSSLLIKYGIPILEMTDSEFEEKETDPLLDYFIQSAKQQPYNAPSGTNIFGGEIIISSDDKPTCETKSKLDGTYYLSGINEDGKSFQKTQTWGFASNERISNWFTKIGTDIKVPFRSVIIWDNYLFDKLPETEQESYGTILNDCIESIASILSAIVVNNDYPDIDVNIIYRNGNRLISSEELLKITGFVKTKIATDTSKTLNDISIIGHQEDVAKTHERMIFLDYISMKGNNTLNCFKAGKTTMANTIDSKSIFSSLVNSGDDEIQAYYRELKKSESIIKAARKGSATVTHCGSLKCNLFKID